MKIAREIESSPVVHEHDEPLDLSMKTKREVSKDNISDHKFFNDSIHIHTLFEIRFLSHFTVLLSLFTTTYNNIKCKITKPPTKIMEYRQKRFRQAQLRQQKDGPGEGGVGVYLTGEEAELGKKLFKKETFNVVASNKISMDRHLNDARPEV